MWEGEIAQINEYESMLINEHDATVFIFGNFAECIRKKRTCTGEKNELPYAFEYVSTIGRINHRAKKATEFGALDRIVVSVGRALDSTRMDLQRPFYHFPTRVMDAVKEQVPEVEYSFSRFS